MTTNEATITSITTGFLSGNLGDGDDPEAYAIALERALMEQYPGAKIEVLTQDGEGSLPYNLKTRVWREGAELPDEDETQWVDQICADVYERGDWRN